MNFTGLVCGAAALVAGGCVYHHERVRQAEPELAAKVAPQSERATIADSDQFMVHSQITGGDFVIQVAKPILTGPPVPGQKWAVTYVLDGTYLFGMMTPTARLLPFERSAQATFVVGVGFPEEAFMAYGARRGRDLIHPAEPNGSPTAQGGGGAGLERFIKEELRPLIESRYPVDGARSVLAGHSLGGLFTATVLANDPDAFAGYMIGSPSMQFDAALAERVRGVAAQGHGRVFIGVGADEGPMVGRADTLEAALKGAGSGFVVARKTFANETHVSSQGAWMSAGLRHVLPPGAGAQ
jgi:predicted alpha/beta superfamily hydrolase